MGLLVAASLLAADGAGAGGVAREAAASAAPAAASPATPVVTPLSSTRPLAAKLARVGRGEVAVTVSRADPLGGPERVDRGQLALEVPDRMRLDFQATGERLAVRGDGGEWVQPAAKQMVRIRPEQVGLASWLWEVFLSGGSDAFRERPRGERRYTLTPLDREAGLPDSIDVRVDAKGLPEQVAFIDVDGLGVRYQFRGWRFMAALGTRAFTLDAPPGYTVVDLP